MTRLQTIKKNYEARYNEKAIARHARERFGFDLPGRGNSKTFWFEVSHRMCQERKREWEAGQRRNRQNQQAKQQYTYTQQETTQQNPQHPTFANIFNAARSRGYCFQEAETLAQKATEMLKTNPNRAYKLFLNRLNIVA